MNSDIIITRLNQVQNFLWNTNTEHKRLPTASVSLAFVAKGMEVELDCPSNFCTLSRDQIWRQKKHGTVNWRRMKGSDLERFVSPVCIEIGATLSPHGKFQYKVPIEFMNDIMNVRRERSLLGSQFLCGECRCYSWKTSCNTWPMSSHTSCVRNLLFVWTRGWDRRHGKPVYESHGRSMVVGVLQEFAGLLRTPPWSLPWPRGPRKIDNAASDAVLLAWFISSN